MRGVFSRLWERACRRWSTSEQVVEKAQSVGQVELSIVVGIGRVATWQLKACEQVQQNRDDVRNLDKLVEVHVTTDEDFDRRFDDYDDLGSGDFNSISMSAALSFTQRCLFDGGVALSYFKAFDTNGRGVVERLDTDLLADPPLRWSGCIADASL